MSFIPLGILAAAGAGGGGAYESIATAVGTGSSGTITFSSIPSTYKHLQVRFMGFISVQGNTPTMRLNNDSGASYSYHILAGNGSAVSATGTGSVSQIALAGANYAQGTTQPIVSIIDIADYSSTTKNKTIRNFLGQDNNGTSPVNGTVYLTSGGWFSTTAVNRLDFILSGANWSTTSVFSLYGIKG
jgi:hypothetical protein